MGHDVAEFVGAAAGEYGAVDALTMPNLVFIGTGIHWGSNEATLRAALDSEIQMGAYGGYGLGTGKRFKVVDIFEYCTPPWVDGSGNLEDRIIDEITGRLSAAVNSVGLKYCNPARMPQLQLCS